MGRMGGMVCALAALALVLPAGAQAQVASPFDCENLGSSKVTTKGPFKALPQEVVEVPSKLDGRALQVGFIRPDAPAGYEAPVIVHASPYHARDLKEADLTQCASYLTENFVQHGYAIALVPVRGGADTDGCANMFGAIERSDLDDVLTWLGTQPWSSGKIGMYGISYSGSTPWVAAASGNDYLKTIVPAAGVTDLFDLAFSGGTLDSRAELFAPLYYLEYGPLINNPATGRDPQRTVNAVADCQDLDEGVVAGRESAMSGARDSSGYWAERNNRPLVIEHYRGSVLHVQGMTDWNVRPQHTIAWANSLRKHGIRVHHLLGQWHHQYPDTVDVSHSRWDFADRLLAWFDHELKGDRSASLGPRVEIEDASGQWRRARRWPPRASRTLHLTADGALADTPGDATASALLASDSRSRFYYAGQDFPENNTESEAELPSAVDELCVTCAPFAMPVEEQLRIAGAPALDVTVTPAGTSGHVTAFLYRKDEAGLHRIGWGMTDLRFPAGERSGDETAAAVTPGAPMAVRIDFEPLDAVVEAGEELVLILGQGRTGQIPAEAPVPVTLAYGGGQGTLSFAVPKPRRRAFFTPPPPEGRVLGQ